jgi:hypothetical protein
MVGPPRSQCDRSPMGCNAGDATLHLSVQALGADSNPVRPTHLYYFSFRVPLRQGWHDELSSTGGMGHFDKIPLFFPCQISDFSATCVWTGLDQAGSRRYVHMFSSAFYFVGHSPRRRPT